MKTEHYDAVIAGSGAGGGTIAWHLCSNGLRVLVLERGPNYDRETYFPDELAAIREGFFSPRLNREPHFVHTRKTPDPIKTDLGWTALCTGGGTVHMGGYLYRFHPTDFQMATLFPSVKELADWPISYEDLEPYYALAEHEIGISGDGSEHFVKRSTPHPMPPVSNNPIAEQLKAVCRKHGLKPFATPVAVNSVPYQGRSACQNCDACGGFGCPIGAKGSAQESFIRRAAATGNLTLRNNAIACEIEMDERGQKAEGIIYIDRESGHKHRVKAELICVSCSSVESARLLLLSRTGKHPDGIGNQNGLVGQYLQFHGATLGSGRIPRQDDKNGKWNPFINVSLADFYNTDFGQGVVTKGAMLRFDMVPRLPLLRAQKWVESRKQPVWGKELLQQLRKELGESDRISYEAFHDFLPEPDTYMQLDSERLDAFGLPSARIHLGSCPTRRKVGHTIARIATKLITEIGGSDFRNPMLGGTVPFLVQGTCRFGVDPETSVLDPNCRVHGINNLYVVDGSFMPTSGGSPPTLTIVANALRVADHMTGKKLATYT